MKKLVLGAAEHLIRTNGKTSTLEVKNFLHDTKKGDPKFALSQSETSHFMRELAGEQKWEKRLVKSPTANYFEYFEKPAQGVKALPSLQSTTSGSLPIICYISSSPKLYAEGTTRREARNKVFKAAKPTMPTLSYDNINTCSRNYFFKNKLK